MTLDIVNKERTPFQMQSQLALAAHLVQLTGSEPDQKMGDIYQKPQKHEFPC